MLVYLGGDLGGHDEHPVRGEDQHAVVCLLPALLQLHRRLQQDLDVPAEGLADPLRRVLGQPSHHQLTLTQAGSGSHTMQEAANFLDRTATPV